MMEQVQTARQGVLVFSRLALVFAGVLYLNACATTSSPKQAGPVGPWQQDIRGVAAYMKADEAFWKEQRAAEEPVEWTGKIFDIEHRTVGLKPGNTIIWLEVPYTKEQTQAGLAPLPIQVVIAPESPLAIKVQKADFKTGKSIHVKGIFKGFVYTGRDYSGKDQQGTTVFGQANDTASALAMIFKQADSAGTAADPMEKAKKYAKAKGLPLKASGGGRVILPLLEVMPEEIELTK
ncbi:MAG: hypothetical protein V1873_08080 [Verrucomicrobiota bacterium]